MALTEAMRFHGNRKVQSSRDGLTDEQEKELDEMAKKFKDTKGGK